MTVGRAPFAWVAPLTFCVHALGAQPALAGAWGDDAIYLQVGRSLARFGTLAVPGLPGAPEVAKYPVGWPLIVAAFDTFRLPLYSILLFNALVWAVVAQIVVSVLLPRLGATNPERFAVGLLLAVNTVTLQVVPTAMSEPTFTLAMIGALLLATGPASRGRLVALAAAVAAAGMLRSVGGLLALGGAVAALACGRRAQGVALGVGWVVQAIVAHAVRAHVALPTGDAWTILHYYLAYDEHTAFYTRALFDGDIREFLDRLASVAAKNAGFGARSVSGLLLPNDYVGGEGASVSNVPLGVALLCLGGVGVIRERALRPAGLLLAAYTAVFVLWTWPFSVRFWLPLWPLLAVASVFGLRALRNVGRLLLLPLVALVVVGHSFVPWYRAKGVVEHGLPPSTLPADETIQAVDAVCAPGDVVLSNLAALYIGAGTHLAALELEALLPADARLALALQLVDPRADAPGLADTITPGLEAILRTLPEGARAWVVLDPSGNGRVMPMVGELVRRGRLVPTITAPLPETPGEWVWELVPG